MRFLRYNTAARVTVGPFLDKTTGVDPEVALTVTSCKLTFMVDDANVPTIVLDAFATAASGANDMVHVAGDDAGFYDLELSTTQTGYFGRAMLSITDAATHCPVFHEFMILPAMIYDAFVLGTDVLDASVTQFLGSAATAASGIPEVKVASIAANAITATAINADAITAAKVADGTIDAATFAAGAINAAAIASDAITAAKIADGAIDAATFAASAITAAALAADAGAEIADAVWDEALSGHAAGGSAGAALTGAGSAGDPWTTALPGAYGAGTAGKIVGDNVNATISSRASQTTLDTLDDFVDTEVAAIKAKTDNLPAAPASTTNITAGVITTVTNLTNAPTSGDLTSTMKASVNTEVLDVMNVDTYAEPGQEAPGATVSLAKKISYLYKFLRNKVTQDSTSLKVYADDGTTVDHKSTVSDDATTYTRGEIASGP